MKIIHNKLPGCYQIYPNIIHDQRGQFIKVFHKEIFNEYGLTFELIEEYYSISYKNVLRGLHFQSPPKAHKKIVYCIQGRIFDVVVDLRINSSTYGLFEVFNLNSEESNILYIPVGCAHGFFVETDIAIVVYNVSTSYSPECDKGILWNSLNIPWPVKNPIISERDSKFPSFSEFKSCFIN